VREKERAVLMEGKTYLLPQADRTKWSMRRNEAESASEVETAAAACATWRNRTGARWGRWRLVGGGGICPMHALEAVDAAAAAVAASGGVVVFRVMSPPTFFFLRQRSGGGGGVFFFLSAIIADGPAGPNLRRRI
jgi:hypothetical protein